VWEVTVACKIPDLLAGVERKTLELLLHVIRIFQVGSQKEVSLRQAERRRKFESSDGIVGS